MRWLGALQGYEATTPKSTPGSDEVVADSRGTCEVSLRETCEVSYLLKRYADLTICAEDPSWTAIVAPS
jgi:hypothetical protein